MSKAKTIKIVVIGVVLAAALLGYYYYLSSKTKAAKEEMVVTTAVQNVLLQDLENYYPPSPKEVLKYYGDITMCFYNEDYSDEELEQMAFKIQELYDDELIANKSEEDYLADLKEEIAGMKSRGCIVVGYQVSASTDVDFYTEDGISYARLYCTFSLREKGQGIASKERFVLRQDKDGHWKILGWELVKN